MKSNTLIAGLVITLLFACSTSVFADGTASSRDDFDLTRLRKFYDDKDMDSNAKMRQLLTYLKGELSHPSRPRMGVAGGPIDTVYIQGVMTGVMAQTVPQENLLESLNEETDKKIKDRIMIALVFAGDMTFVPYVQSFLKRAEENMLREGAALALGRIAHKDSELLLRSLKYDTYSRVGLQDVGSTTRGYQKVYPVRQAAYVALSRIGAKPKGWVLKVPLAVDTEIEAVASILDDENPEQCVTILQMLGDYPAPQARTIVDRFLKDSVGKPHLTSAVKEANITLRKMNEREREKE